MARPLTRIDRTIIRLLQRDARSSYAELSRLAAIPESTVRRRLDRLQAEGLIDFAVIVDPTMLGYEFQAMVGLKIELRQLDAIAAALREMPEVTYAVFLTGNFDVMLQIVVPSQGDLVEFLTKRLAPIDGIRSTETFMMPWVIKPITSWALPLPGESEPKPVLETEVDEDITGRADGDGGSDDGADSGPSPARRRAPGRPALASPRRAGKRG